MVCYLPLMQAYTVELRERIVAFVEKGSSKVDAAACFKVAIIVLDNASFRRSPALLALAEAAGVTLVFLPTYSPDLNDIEHVWATLKCSLRGGLHEAEDKIAFIDKACLALCS